MVSHIVKTCEIELSPDELGILTKAREIIAEIADIACEEDVVGFKMAQEREDYSMYEISNCAILLNNLCHPCGRLSGYFHDWRSSVGET